MIADTMIDNTENEIENLCLQECFYKNASFWKLVISPKTPVFNIKALLM